MNISESSFSPLFEKGWDGENIQQQNKLRFMSRYELQNLGY